MGCSGMRPTIESFYKLTVKNNTPLEMEFESFDFNIINTGNTFADSLMNEIWPLLRLFWKSQGAYDIEIIFDPDQDLNEFSDRLAGNYTASYKFSIDANGNWDADFDCVYKQDENAWRYSDYSRADSVAASRARQLAEPESDGISTWTMEKYKKHMTLLDELILVDFSFEHKYIGNGIWN